MRRFLFAAGLAALSACPRRLRRLRRFVADRAQWPETPPPAGAVIINVVRENGAQSFSPNPATVPAGQLVSWHNVDTTTHHVRTERRKTGQWQPFARTIQRGDDTRGAGTIPLHDSSGYGRDNRQRPVIMVRLRHVRILAVSGSLQAKSKNVTLLTVAARLAPPGAEVIVFDGLRDLPHFNPDVDASGAPESVLRWRQALASSDAILIASPSTRSAFRAR